MATLHARDLTVSFGPAVVLDAVSLTVAPGHRLGVVGPNGTGKSTLLRVLSDLLVPDSGSVSLSPRAATVGFLPQEPDRRADETVLAFLARRTGVAAASAALDAATTALAEGSPGADDHYGDALERWLALGRPTSSPGPRRSWPTWAWGPGCPTRPRPPCRAARRPGCRWPPSCCPASTSSCSTSPPTTSTSTAWPGWSASSSGSTPAPWSSPTTGPSSSGW